MEPSDAGRVSGVYIVGADRQASDIGRDWGAVSDATVRERH
jgi:hypothetical protein